MGYSHWFLKDLTNSPLWSTGVAVVRALNSHLYGLGSTFQSFFVVSQTSGISMSFLTLAKLHWLPLGELANVSPRQTQTTCLGFVTPTHPCRVCLVPPCQDDSQRRFLVQHRITTTLLRHCFEWLQHCSNIATMCCAWNRRFESSRVKIGNNATVTRTWKKKQQHSNNSNFNSNSNFTRASRLSHFFAAFALLRRENASFHVNKQFLWRNFVSLSELGYGPLEFNFRRVRPDLTK